MIPSFALAAAVGRAPFAALLLFFAILIISVRAELNNDTSPTSQFRSRPDLHAPIVQFWVIEPQLLVPGYLFLAPYRNLDPSPYIYDNYGQLVWSGAGSSGPKTAHAPRVCQYKGENHLCYYQGEQHQGFARGHGVIMDKHYRVVKTVESSGAGASADMHEFKMTPFSNGTSVLMTVYQPRQYDLTVNPRFNVQRGMGWVVEGVFQEIDIDSGQLLFEWRSLDHVDPNLAWTMPASTDTSGDGLDEQTPWDYFHINSVDKNVDGDYLISARHVSAIYKVSGKDGHIVWQMGGTAPTIHTTDFVFSYQHHARWLHENSTHTVLSFYDNASNTFNSSGNSSHAWVVGINHVTNEANLLREFGAPDRLLSGSQGNMQMLWHGGCHIGWGEHPRFSEHLANGTVVMYGELAERASNVMIYRSNKYNWTGLPLTKPALSTYSMDGGLMMFWVSWNGATEVTRWRFFVGPSPSGPWKFGGERARLGFETEHTMWNASDWSYAEALDKHGRVLERSEIAKTFFPSRSLVASCNIRGCGQAEGVPEDERVDYEAPFELQQDVLSPNRGFDTTHYYQDFNRSPPLGLGLAAVLLLVGLLAGIGTAGAFFVLWQKGMLGSLAKQTGMLRVKVAQSMFGNVLAGKYNKLRGEEASDGWTTGLRAGQGGHSARRSLSRDISGVSI